MYSVIKVGGFALGIAACLLIALYIKDELSYDRYYPTTDRVYRMAVKFNFQGKEEIDDSWPPPMAKAMREDFPEVEKAGRLMPHPLFYCAGSNQVRTPDKEENAFEEGFTYADQDMLDILQLPMVYGDRAHALSEPKTIVITRRKAEKYFPNQNPVGKTLILNNDKDRIYKVGGVIENFPTNSHIQYDFWLTMTGYELWKDEQQGWGSQNYYTYVLLKPGVNVPAFQKKLRLIADKYYMPMALKSNDKEYISVIDKAKIIAQPVTDIHLHSYNIDDEIPKGDIRFVWLFGAIACFILIIACINFINLSTARSANRAKEVGLRKVVGSNRSGLIQQFLVESLIISILSFIIGIVLAAISLPWFNTLFGKALVIPWTTWWLFPVIIGASLIVGVFAGIYPSFYLSAFKPISVLKGQLSKGVKSSLLRNGLVVFQFSISIILIIGTLVIYTQTHHILNTKIGFDKDQVMIIEGTNTLDKQEPIFKNELLKTNNIKNVTTSDYLPVAGTKRDGNSFTRDGKQNIDAGVGAEKWIVDNDYLNTLGMKILEGRNFRKDMRSDSSATIINKKMAEKMGLKNPVGQRITNGWQTLTVIGVMDDFNFETMRREVGPLCLIVSQENSTLMAVKFNTADTKSVIAEVGAVWKSFAPNQPFRYTFLDESFANMYADVERTGSIFTTFAVLAIIIACLGLFALSAFMAEQRNKEIGIRKVLGASVGGITTMLSKNFVMLVLISIVIASPIAWWGMNKWLEDFAADYRIEIAWWMFTVAGSMAIFIALVTVSFQSIKAALMNPVRALRSE
jgi:putative ABC transport system permease protein